MCEMSKNLVLLLMAVAGTIVMAAGCWIPNVWLAFGGGIVLCYVLAQLVWLRRAIEHETKQLRELGA